MGIWYCNGLQSSCLKITMLKVMMLQTFSNLTWIVITQIYHLGMADCGRKNFRLVTQTYFTAKQMIVFCVVSIGSDKELMLKMSAF